ncbi:toxin Cry1Ac domain D-VI-related protein [Paenilisteria newyorkensis]|uniref:toxin Cry1Ac domain D-VI-related protein n=1 Tax=Listeria newyorkensis TaxID=1497681 RepID=UPI000741094C|nr:toxin Cry1Ac domain D-VI-related protein [Listeria newyorkensis]
MFRNTNKKVIKKETIMLRKELGKKVVSSTAIAALLLSSVSAPVSVLAAVENTNEVDTTASTVVSTEYNVIKNSTFRMSGYEVPSWKISAGNKNQEAEENSLTATKFEDGWNVTEKSYDIVKGYRELNEDGNKGITIRDMAPNGQSAKYITIKQELTNLVPNKEYVLTFKSRLESTNGSTGQIDVKKSNDWWWTSYTSEPSTSTDFIEHTAKLTFTGNTDTISISGSNGDAGNLQYSFSDVQLIPADKYEEFKAEKEKEEAAQKAIDELFVDNNPENNVKDTVTQADIDNAQAKIDEIQDETKKAELQEQLDKAQAELDAKNEAAEKEEAAQTAIDELFINNNPANNIKDTVTQADIDDAQAKVNAVTDPSKKAELQTQLDKAQNDLNAKKDAEAKEAATAAVKDLFVGNNPANNIKDTTNQKAIDEAQKLVDAIKDPSTKAELQKDINNAQEKLDTRNAIVVAPTVSAVTNKDTEVKGKGTPGYKVVVKIGSETYTGVVGINGDFSVNIPVQKADTLITVAQQNPEKTGPSVTVKVGNYIPAAAPIIDSVGPFQQAITGKVPAGTVSVRLLVNGVPQRLVAPDANGNFSFYSRFVSDGTVSNLRLQKGDIITVDYGIRTPANLSTTVVVNNAVKPIVDTVQAESDYITGLVPTGTQVLRLSINGVAQRTVTPQEDIEAITAGGIGSNGKFKIYSRFFKDETGLSRKLKAGDKITVDLGAQIPGDTGTTVTVVAK